jgi:hypothetical protein
MPISKNAPKGASDPKVFYAWMMRQQLKPKVQISLAGRFKQWFNSETSGAWSIWSKSKMDAQAMAKWISIFEESVKMIMKTLLDYPVVLVILIIIMVVKRVIGPTFNFLL